MEVVNQALGTEGKLDIEVAGGKIILNLVHAHASGKVTLAVEEDAVYFANLLMKKLGLGDSMIQLIDGAITIVK
jgi:hypothetical protein